MGTAKDTRDPLGAALDELRGLVESLSIREQNIDVVDTVGRGMSQNRILQRSECREVMKDLLDLGVGQSCGTVSLILRLENVVVHEIAFRKRVLFCI